MRIDELVGGPDISGRSFRKSILARNCLWAFGLLMMIVGNVCSPKAAAASPTAALDQDSSRCAFPKRDWAHIDQAQQAQWDTHKLLLAQQDAERIHSAAVVIVQCGKVVAEWGNPAKKITSFSVRKSLISALYGIYSADGVIDINQTLEQAGIDDLPSPLTQEERQARIVDLLRARSGVYHAADFETDFQRKGRPARGSHPPGTFWLYNNWDFNALGTIFEKKTGVKIGDAFYQRIARPIGMQDFKPNDLYYVGDGTVSTHRAYMFEMTARDMARFGLLYLNHGRWKGRQIVPADWVEKSTHTTEMVHVGHMPVGGYEYLWWVEYGGVHLGEATLPGMYSAQGAGGHIILVVPSRNLVIVNRYDNEPQARDPKSVLLAAQDHHAIFDDDLAHLVKLILDAQMVQH
jgi:CubicO group peptidase (beta-lactamase class C family)